MEKLHYMHANPVVRGLVTSPKDWPWSSWNNYYRHGEALLSINPRERNGNSAEEKGNPKTRVPNTGTRGTLRP